MKKQLFILAFILVGLTNCKKESENISALFANSIWTGAFIADLSISNDPEPYSMAFSSDGSFSWQAPMGEADGTWKLEGKHLTVTFSNGTIVTADIGSDNKLANISGNTIDGFTILHGDYNDNAEQSLSNSSWHIENGNGALNFQANNVIDFAGNKFNYTRKGAAIRFTLSMSTYFFIIMADGVSMFGVYNTGSVTEQIFLKKQ